VTDGLHTRSGETRFPMMTRPGGVFQYTIPPQGPERIISDTWHRDIDEAKAQAAYWADSTVGPWRSVSQELVDALWTIKGGFGY
jgi:hypothetical protein